LKCFPLVGNDHKSLRISLHPWKGGAIEACLNNLSNVFVGTKVSTISESMGMMKETMDLTLQQSSPVNLIST